MKKDKILNILNEISPLELQYEWDNCGMQIDLGKTEHEKVLLAMEICDSVIDEAIECGASLIITHHPLMFRAVKQINSGNIIQNYVIRLIQAGIEVYSMHTCFDKCKGGLNDALLALLGIENAELLGDGCGRIGVLPGTESLEKLVYKLDDKLNHPGIRFSGELESKIKTVACCTGAGSEYIEDAIAQGADLFITGEVKHNYGMEAREKGLSLIEAGHWGTEQIFADTLAPLLREKAKTLKLVKSKVDINPLSSII